MTEDIIALARQYCRYGYREIADLLRGQGRWVVNINDKRVERIWLREGPKTGRLSLNDGFLAKPITIDTAGFTSSGEPAGFPQFLSHMLTTEGSAFGPPAQIANSDGGTFNLTSCGIINDGTIVAGSKAVIDALNTGGAATVFRWLRSLSQPHETTTAPRLCRALPHPD